MDLIFPVLFIAINFLGFLFMGIDKRKAQKHKRRIEEKTLWLIAIAGGALGTAIGMFFFRHKTKHWYFRFGLPVLAILEAGLFLFYTNLL